MKIKGKLANAESASANISNLNFSLYFVEACNEFCGAHLRDIAPRQHSCLLKSLEAMASHLQSRSTPTSGPPKVSARAPAHRSYHFRGVKLKSCIKKIHHNLYISKQANVRIKHADTEGASHKKFGTDARVQ